MNEKSPREKRIIEIAKRLNKEYPDADCELEFANNLQLLIAVILSAQCTDKRVNLVTPALFKKYKTVQAFASAELDELEGLVRSTGFFKNKAKNIKKCCQDIVSLHGGEVPASMEALVKLAGVGRKTANAVLMHGFNQPGLTVDTHFKRLTKRMALTKEKDPVKIEFDIAGILPKKAWTKFSSCLIWHGRRVCAARKPCCAQCTLVDLCPAREV
jgi:endonuclease-3